MTTSVVLAVAAIVLSSTAGFARTYDPATPWFLEGAVGTLQRGPSGTDFGAGQNYSAHLGFQTNAWSDVGLSLAWANGRSTSRAIEASVTSGGARARGWLNGGRWSPYAELGARLYRALVEQRNVQDPLSERRLRVGAEVGAGVLYSRSTWWGGLGVELHVVAGSLGVDEAGSETFTTYNLLVGVPLGR